MAVPHFLETLLDRPIAFHPVFAELTRSINAGLMLSQAIYWSKRTKNEEGWFYKKQAEWQAETYLTRYEQDSARAILRTLGKHFHLSEFWHEERRGVPARIYYRIDFDLLAQHLSAHHHQIVENQQSESDVDSDLTAKSKKTNVEKPQTRLGKNHNLDWGKPAIKSEENQQSGLGKTSNHSLQRLLAETTSSSRKRSARTHKPATAAAKSKFAETLILDYLEATKPNNQARNAGLAHKLWLTGSDDHLIQRWNQKRAAKSETITQEQMAEVMKGIEADLTTAEWLLQKHELEPREKEWLPAIITNLATRPDLAPIVAQLKGLL